MTLEKMESKGNPGDGKRISLLRLERHLLDESTPEQRAQLKAELESDKKMAAYLHKMEAVRSPLDWSRVRKRLPRSAGRPGLKEIFAAAAVWLDAFLPRPSRKSMAIGGAFAALLLMIPVAYMARNDEESTVRAKGISGSQISLEVGGAKVAPGQRRHVKSGDILTFTYRSSKPLYTQIWYLEDGGSPRLFDGKGDTSLYWSPSGSWEIAPQRIRLEGEWKVQRILVLASEKIVPGEEALRIVKGLEKPGSRGKLFTYELLQP